MRIRSKLISITSLVIGGFIMLTLFLLWAHFTTNAMHRIRTDSLSLLARWNAVNRTAQSFLVEKDAPQELHRDITRSRERLEEATRRIAAHRGSWYTDAETGRMVGSILSQWDLVSVSFDSIERLSGEIVGSGLAGDIEGKGVLAFFIRAIEKDSLPPEVLQTMQSLEGHVSSLRSSSQTFTTQVDRLNAHLAERIERYMRLSGIVSLLLFGLITLAALSFAVTASLRIGRRIEAVQHIVHSTAERDLRSRYRGTAKDEVGALGQDINKVLELMHRFLRESGSLAQGVGELKEKLSEETESSVRKTEEIRSRLDELTADFSRLDATIDSARSHAGRIADTVSSTRSSISDQESPLVRISDAAERMNESIRRVAELSSEHDRSTRKLHTNIKEGEQEVRRSVALTDRVTSRIGELLEIVRIIDDISEQTHLLAINATIESANAGAAGGSFAVIAGEIKELAAGSAQQAHRIDDMLEEITAEMERSRQASRSSAEAFSRIDATVDELLGFSRDVANRGEELAARGEEIVETTGTVNSLTSHIRSEYEAIEELAGRILAQIEESASSSSRGLERITSIRDSVSDFLSSITAVDARGKETGAWIASLRELIETFRYDESGDSGEAS